MKKWRTPEIQTLNIHNTTVEGCTCDSVSGGGRFCHFLGSYHKHNCNLIKSFTHHRNQKCNGVHWNAPQDSKCCCGGYVAPGGGLS